MIRLVLDPGVLVSAAIVGGGAPALILEAIREGRADLIVSERLLGELDGVLARPRFRKYLTVEQAQRFVAAIRRIAIVEDDVRTPPRVSRDPDDDYLVALARSAGAVALVSGDKDLTSLKDASPPVFTPRQTLDRLEEMDDNAGGR